MRCRLVPWSLTLVDLEPSWIQVTLVLFQISPKRWGIWCRTQRMSDWKPTVVFDRHCELWPRMTFNPPSSRSLKFDIKYFENGDTYDDVVNGSQIGSHPCALWPWLTLNRPRSRSPPFHFKYLKYGEFAHKVGISIGNRQSAWILDYRFELWIHTIGQIHIPQNVFLLSMLIQYFNSILYHETLPVQDIDR